MARKPDPKPLFDIKADFYASLDNFTQQTLMLVSAVEMALRAGALTGEAKTVMEERVTALRNAMSGGG